jgi:tetratricopeptide (TPR) repeat protein
MVSSSLVTPLRPRDFDISTIERAAAFLTHGERGMLLRLYAYMHYLDRGEVAEALRYFDAAQAIYPQNAKNLDADCAPDFVFVHAVLKHDLEGARQWWQRLEATGDRRRNIDYWRARAALLCIEGNIEEGRGAFEQGQGVAARLPACGAYDYDRDMLARVGQSLDATAVPPALPDADPIPATLTPVS